MRVDAEKEASLRSKISREVANIAKELRTEIQDDGEFLLVSIIPREEATAEDIEDALLRARRILLPAIPPRVGVHSWMITISEQWGHGPVSEVVFSEILPGEIDEAN